MSSSSSDSHNSCASPMSATSSTSGSPPSHPIQIGFTPRTSDALLEIFGSTAASITSSTCAYPCWPAGGSLYKSSQGSHGSAYISDEDLFGEIDVDQSHNVALLNEAPEPPRTASHWYAQPLLPLVASGRPRQVRRGSKKTARRLSKALSPIEEHSM